MDMPLTVYVYYRVAAGSESAALSAARSLLAAVARDTGCQTQLSCRCDDTRTFMETYAGFPDRTVLLHSIARGLTMSGLNALIEPPGRHLECFTPL